MKNWIRPICFGLCLFLVHFSTLYAQSDTIQYAFEKGAVLDFLFLNQNPESDSLKKIYFKTAIPIAIKNGYKPAKGFQILDYPLAGNYHPQAIVVASWPDLDTRQRCLEELVAEVPDFHFLRRAIWTNFNLLFYELKEDLAFDVVKSNYNVMTTFWGKEDAQNDLFLQEWKAAVKASGGRLVIEFGKGLSTFGYSYQPNQLIIVEWPDKAAFQNFQKKCKKLDFSSLFHINQFHLQ